MTIQLDCTGCKTPLRLPDDMAGTRVRCVQCGAILTIPSPTAHYWPPGVPAAAAAGSVSQSAAAVSARGVPPAIPPSPLTRHAAPEPAVLQAPIATPVAPQSPAQTSQATPFRHAVPGVNGSSHHAAAGPHRASRPVMILEAGDCAALDEVDDRPASISIGDVLKRARGIYKHNFRSLVAAGVLLIALVALVNAAVAASLQLVGARYVIRFCLGQALLVWLMLGTMDFMVKTARGGRRGLATLLGGMPHYGSGLVIWAVCFVPLALAALGAGALGVSPLLVAATLAAAWLVVSFVIWIPALLALVDDQLPALAALAKAASYARRNLVPLAGLLAISTGILAASCLPLGLGLPVAGPFVLLVSTVAYLRDRANQE